MQGLGYKEFFDYFDGEMSLEETVDKVKRDTRRFAKRQLTWFRRDERIHWIFADDFNSPLEIFRFADDMVEHFFSL